MIIVRENLYEFQRGQEPKETLKIGGEYDKIKKWLSQFIYKGQWKLNDDWTIDIIRADFIISGEKISEFPEFINFNKAYRDFIVSNADMELFKGFPKIIEGNLSVSDNAFTSLHYFPEYVGGDVTITRNKGKTFSESEISSVCDVQGKIRSW